MKYKQTSSQGFIRSGYITNLPCLKIPHSNIHQNSQKFNSCSRFAEFCYLQNNAKIWKSETIKNSSKCYNAAKYNGEYII